MALSDPQFWVTVVGVIVPLGGYLINRFAPWASETVKGAVQVLLAAVAAALYAAINTSVFGWNAKTGQLVLTGVIAALVAHNFFYKPAKVNTKLGATERSVPGE